MNTAEKTFVGSLIAVFVLIVGMFLGTVMEGCRARRHCQYGTVRTLVADGDGYDVVCAAPACPSGAPPAASASNAVTYEANLCALEYKNAVDEVYRCREDLWRYEAVYHLCQAGRTLDSAACANTAIPPAPSASTK